MSCFYVFLPYVNKKGRGGRGPHNRIKTSAAHHKNPAVASLKVCISEARLVISFPCKWADLHTHIQFHRATHISIEKRLHMHAPAHIFKLALKCYLEMAVKMNWSYNIRENSLMTDVWRLSSRGKISRSEMMNVYSLRKKIKINRCINQVQCFTNVHYRISNSDKLQKKRYPHT